MNKNTKKKPFKEYLQEIESPEYDGADASWGLPENPTPLEKAKYEICEKILAYQQDNNLSDKKIATKIHLTTGETRDILYCHIDYFTLDRLITYAGRLFAPLEVKMIVGPKETDEFSHAQVV